MFLDHQAIQSVVEDRELARADALLEALPRRPHTTTPGGRMYVKCPTCKVVMNRRLFATGSGIVVDVCRQHGMFFDGGELPAIVQFVMEGGLERAAKKDAERKQRDEEREREKREQQYWDVQWQSEPSHRKGNALIDFLLDLFF